MGTFDVLTGLNIARGNFIYSQVVCPFSILIRPHWSTDWRSHGCAQEGADFSEDPTLEGVKGQRVKGT